jgi:hypothetical protein
MQKGGRRYVLLLGALTLVAAAAAAILGAADATSSSTAIKGRMLNISNFPCASATGVCSSFTSTGAIRGEGTVFIDTFPTPYPTPQSRSLVSAAHTIIETKKGNLTCSELAIFDAPRPDHPFVDLCIVTGGTGIYAGATGYIQESGTFDFAANVGQLEYIGQLELARS